MPDRPYTYQYPRRRVVRATLKQLIRFGLFLFSARVDVVGRENIPAEGPVLVVANHFHFSDPVVIIGIFPAPIEFLGGFQLIDAPKSLAWLTSLYGYHRVRRGGVSRNALRAAEDVLAQNGFLGIFPEGGSWASVLRPARPGVPYIASQSAARILPIGIDGMTDLFPLRFTRRTHITVRIGEPFGPFTAAGNGRRQRADLDDIGHEIMRHIRDLLPPERHGVYSDDPAIRAAAADAAIYPYGDLNTG